MDTNIVLVGMPASGKTTIANLLADRLEKHTVIDTDSVIERTQGLLITEIFKKYSEDYFRKLEYDTIKMVCNGTSKILSIGGGAFENPDSRAMLLKFGKVFYLKSDLDVLYCRVIKDDKRPLLQNENPREILEKILQKREENYNKAHYVIDVSELTELQVVESILGIINEANIKR